MADKLGILPETLLVPESLELWANHEVPSGTYQMTWKKFIESAERLGDEFKKFNANTILTFSGSSLIATGMVMTLSMQASKVFQSPVYVGFFLREDSKRYDDEIRQGIYDAIRVLNKTLLIPRAMFSDRPDVVKRIFVLDDVIITGHTMNALRDYLGKVVRPRPVFEFGALICHKQCKLYPGLAPKCDLTTDCSRIEMPWGRYAEPFEAVSGDAMTLEREENPNPAKNGD